MPRFGEREDRMLGACVLLVGAGFLAWVHGSDPTPAANNGLTLHTSFQRTDGLSEGAEVRLAGIPVGKVTSMILNDRFQSKVILQLDDDILVPEDSAAVIHTDGLFGGKYIEIEPGGALDSLQDGDSIAYTQDSLVVGDLLERLTAMAKSHDTKCAEIMAQKPPTCVPPTTNGPDGQPAQPEAPSLLLPLSQGKL